MAGPHHIKSRQLPLFPRARQYLSRIQPGYIHRVSILLHLRLKKHRHDSSPSNPSLLSGHRRLWDLAVQHQQMRLLVPRRPLEALLLVQVWELTALLGAAAMGDIL